MIVLIKIVFVLVFFFVMLLWDADSHFSKLYFEYICAWSNDHTEKDVHTYEAYNTNTNEDDDEEIMHR